jgi:antitoxin component YwqK of YwqJK toxin-antitoxin module
MRRIIAILLFCSFQLLGFTQESRLKEIRIDDLEILSEEFGADSVSNWIGGLPIWLLNEQIAINIATQKDPDGHLNYFVKKLGQNVIDIDVASKLNSLYQEWFHDIQKTNFNEELIPIQDDRLILSLLHQTNLDRKKNLENELAILESIRDSIRSGQPKFFKKIGIFFKGGEPITENKKRIEHSILKTYYQLNKIDAISYSKSGLKKQARKIASWQRPYRPERFDDKLQYYHHTITQLKANTAPEIDIKKLRNIESILNPAEGMTSGLTKIYSDRAMILSYGISDGFFGGWGETILVTINDENLVEFSILNAWF